jgi:hypothetical protein
MATQEMTDEQVIERVIPVTADKPGRQVVATVEPYCTGRSGRPEQDDGAGITLNVSHRMAALEYADNWTWLSAEEARRVARSLTDAADVIEKRPVKLTAAELRLLELV